jgi:hypothetical protein
MALQITWEVIRCNRPPYVERSMAGSAFATLSLTRHAVVRVAMSRNDRMMLRDGSPLRLALTGINFDTRRRDPSFGA